MLVPKALSHGRDALSLCSMIFGSGVSAITRGKNILLFPQKSPPPRQNDTFLMLYSKVQFIYILIVALLARGAPAVTRRK